MLQHPIVSAPHQHNGRGINPRRHREMQPPSGFPRITRERIGRSSRNLVYLTIEQFYIFPENFKFVPTMTFNLIFKVMSSEIYVPNSFNAWNSQTSVCLLVIWTWICVGRWHPWFTLTSWPFRGQPRSSEVNDLWWRHMSFFGFLYPHPGVIWCADFEFGIRLPFISVEIRSLEPYNTQKKNANFYEKIFSLILTPKNGS